MDTGTIVQWHKKEGDEIAPGDLICEVQTDKAVVGMELDEEGIMAKIIKPEGSVNKVGEVIAVMANTEEDWKEVNSNADAFVASLGGGATASPASDTPTQSSPQEPPVSVGKQLPIGPAVRLLLSSYGLSSTQIAGTGPRGTVLKSDVLAYVASKGLQKVPQTVSPVPGVAKSQADSSQAPISGAGFIDIPLTTMRATIAARLHQSKATIPHAYTSATFSIDRLFNLQKVINKAELVDLKVSINDLVLKACAYALRLVPEVNGTSAGNGTIFQQSKDVDICVAVSTPAGLITPIVKCADRLPISEISARIKNLASRARENKLKPEEFTGGSFTISNLGMFGIREFSAIINPPQVAILAVGSGQRRLQEGADGDIAPVTTLTVTLSADARFVDEVTAANFLRHVQRYLESSPEALYEDDPQLAAAAGCRDLSIMAV